MEYELSLSPDYVSSWTLVDAVRELCQNALDQEVTQPGNTASFHYDGSRLIISNALSELSVKSLLLGTSTKKADESTIGQFGEGYKIASLVLARMDKEVTFHNRSRHEQWIPTLKYNDRYGSKLLNFTVEPFTYSEESIEKASLSIVVRHIDQGEYASIVESNLHLQKDYNKIETPMGEILLDRRHMGKVFVNGLYVCSHRPYVKGYNFKPKYIKLDRDRKFADAFELEWIASSMWSSRTDGNEDVVSQLIMNSAADVKFYNAHRPSSTGNSKVSDISVARFFKEHGKDAMPVVTDKDIKDLPKNKTPVIVTENVHKVLMQSEDMKKIKRFEVERKTKLERLDLWFERNKQHLPLKEKRNFTKIRKEFGK